MIADPAFANASERIPAPASGREAAACLDPAEVHALAVAVANILIDDALDTANDLDFPARRGLLLLAASVERDGARRAGVEPEDGGVLREAVSDLAEMERDR